MTLDQLRMLVKIEETGSVLAAAEALFRTQPTVSVAIRKLEDELGVQLLDRDQYRAQLTPAGGKLCRKAKDVIGQANEFATLARHMASGHEPELRIAIEASCPIPLILDVLKKLESRFPQTEFNLMVENIWGALTRLKNGEADLAISPWFEENTGLDSFTLMHEQMIAVASPQFPPLRERKKLDQSTMRENVQVIVKDSSVRPREKTIGVIASGRHWLVNDHYTKKAILLAGMGWGRLQSHLIAGELESGTLVPLAISNYESVIDIEIRVARPLDGVVGPVAAEMWRVFQAIAASAGDSVDAGN